MNTAKSATSPSTRSWRSGKRNHTTAIPDSCSRVRSTKKAAANRDGFSAIKSKKLLAWRSLVRDGNRRRRFWLAVLVARNRRRQRALRDLAETIDARKPVLIEWRINHAVMAR